ncbi:MAG: peptidoglycan DD-metalloendopeptidase family protein [Lachnospiraceae bacterium]
MKKTNKIISFLMIMILCFGTVMPVSATSVDEAQKKAQDLEAEKQAAETQKSGLAAQLNTIVSDMQKAKEKLTVKETEIETVENELVQSKIEEHSQYESMKKRIRYMYENGNVEFIEILLDSQSITDFLNKAEYVKQISSYDRQMLVQFQKLVQTVATKETELKEEYKQLKTCQEELTAKQTEVETLMSQKSTEISQLQGEIGANSEVLQKLLSDAQAAERKRQEAIQYQTNPGGGSGGDYSPGAPSISGSGQFTNPCPSGSVSSPFGPRDGGFHKGLDLAAPEGSPIYAADSGYVAIAGYSSSAGNWVVIDHGNGITTKYMHMVSSPYVSSGQNVSRGQNIGAVGNTGNSFGNHLHFQVEVNGTAVNPASYL